MNTNDLKEMIDGTIIDVPKGDCYLLLTKVGNEVHVSYEGEKDMIKASLFSLIHEYNDLAEVVLDAAEAYETEEI